MIDLNWIEDKEHELSELIDRIHALGNIIEETDKYKPTVEQSKQHDEATAEFNDAIDEAEKVINQLKAVDYETDLEETLKLYL